MRIYSAGEAIGPAWEHTTALLFRDRRLGRLLKICLVALGAQLGGNIGGKFGNQSGHTSAALLPLLLMIGVLSFAFGVTLMYVASRLQFVLFDIVLLRDDRVGPAWRRHGIHTWRWLGVRIAFGAALLLALSPLCVPLVPGLIHLFRSPAFQTATGGHAFNFAAFRAAALLLLEALAVVLVFVALFRLFTTLALPGLALENLSFGAVFKRAWLLVSADPPAMLAYTFVQPLLLFALGTLVLFCWVLAVGIPALPVGLVLVHLWRASHAGVGGMVLMGIAGGLGAIVLLLWAVLTYLLLAGTLLVFAQAYNLYFLGGRYPLLGQYLEPAAIEPEPRLGFRE